MADVWSALAGMIHTHTNPEEIMGKKVLVTATGHSNVTNAQATTVAAAAATFLAALVANGFSAADTQVEVQAQEASTPAT
jgi:hypothetical protein